MTASVRRIARAAIALLAAAVATLVAGPATPAHAATGWYHGDDMEIHGGYAPPAARFFFETSDGYSMGSMKNDAPTETLPIKAHSGSYYADLGAGYGTAWGSVGQNVYITPVANGARPTCTFSAWTYAGYVDLNIEVINPDTWTYLAVATVRHGLGWQYQKMSTPSFTPAVRNVVLRVSLLGPYTYGILAHVDDFALSCSY